MLFLDGRDDMARWAEEQPLEAEPGAKFLNYANFRGFPHIPGQDTILRYASSDGGHDGGVL